VSYTFTNCQRGVAAGEGALQTLMTFCFQKSKIDKYLRCHKPERGHQQRISKSSFESRINRCNALVNAALEYERYISYIPSFQVKRLLKTGMTGGLKKFFQLIVLLVYPSRAKS
jgi:hypothetical protein